MAARTISLELQLPAKVGVTEQGPSRHLGMLGLRNRFLPVVPEVTQGPKGELERGARAGAPIDLLFLLPREPFFRCLLKLAHATVMDPGDPWVLAGALEALTGKQDSAIRGYLNRYLLTSISNGPPSDGCEPSLGEAPTLIIRDHNDGRPRYRLGYLVNRIFNNTTEVYSWSSRSGCRFVGERFQARKLPAGKELRTLLTDAGEDITVRCIQLEREEIRLPDNAEDWLRHWETCISGDKAGSRMVSLNWRNPLEDQREAEGEDSSGPHARRGVERLPLPIGHRPRRDECPYHGGQPRSSRRLHRPGPGRGTAALSCLGKRSVQCCCWNLQLWKDLYSVESGRWYSQVE